MRILRVGLTGGIGSGKSAVARLFADWGAVLADGDVLARAALEPGTAGYADVVAAWPQVRARDGTVDRRALSAIVFADAGERARLNAIVHPRVREAAARIEAGAPDGAVVVHVIPLLFEGEYWKRCDRTVLVVAPREARIARVSARDAWPRTEIEARMAAQIDPERARAMADLVIVNDAGFELLERRARAVWDALCAALAG